MVWREIPSPDPDSLCDQTRSSKSLASKDGELISVRACVEPRFLEDLIEALAELPFAVNPQIFHPHEQNPLTQVEFPAYESWLPRIRSAVERAGLAADSIEVRSMLAAIHRERAGR